MGKGTDKLYITHSEWASSDAFSASAGAGLSKASTDGSVPFKRLPFNFCALSLQPFKTPVCTSNGTIFDIDNILPWLRKHGTNPVNGAPLKSDKLVKLRFAKNDDGEMVDPVTYKVLTDNTHIVALLNTGNVFAWETVERLNIKAKNWKDLVTEEEFGRKDIITLQDPQNIESRNLTDFKYLKEGVETRTEEQKKAQARNVNTSALGNAASVLPRKEPSTKPLPKLATLPASTVTKPTKAAPSQPFSTPKPPASTQPTALHTTGRAAASFTSTGFTPHTSTTSDLALLSTEDYLLRPKRVKAPGYLTLRTTHGLLPIALFPEFAPRAVWNFLTLSKRGYYDDAIFHRSIKNFMIQGGDPSGTGKGGQSSWGTNFADEFDGPRSHDARGVVSMANKGKNTNSSQFFILYRPAKHLDRKHTVFGQVTEKGMDTLKRMEAVEVGKGDRPVEEVRIEGVNVLVDPFEEFLKEKGVRETREEKRKEIERNGGAEDDRTTWTGKRVRGGPAAGGGDGGESGVGKYLKAANAATENGTGTGIEAREEWEVEEPVKKKVKAGGGFGNFDGW